MPRARPWARHGLLRRKWCSNRNCQKYSTGTRYREVEFLWLVFSRLLSAFKGEPRSVIRFPHKETFYAKHFTTPLKHILKLLQHSINHILKHFIDHIDSNKPFLVNKLQLVLGFHTWHFVYWHPCELGPTFVFFTLFLSLSLSLIFDMEFIWKKCLNWLTSTMDLPSLSQLKALRVVDLKQRLAQLGLPQSGKKHQWKSCNLNIDILQSLL